MEESALGGSGFPVTGGAQAEALGHLGLVGLEYC
jgi:hypothetical protein